MIERHGWTLLFHECVVEQMRKLAAAVDQAKLHDSQGFEANANVKLFRALTHVMLQAVSGDLNRDEYRQGNTMGPAFRHWCRAKVGQRFRLFFRFDSKAKIIVFAMDKQPMGTPPALHVPTTKFRRCQDATRLSG